MADNNNITLRAVKGEALTYAQMDTNFRSLYYSSSYSGSTIQLHYTGSSAVPISGRGDTHTLSLRQIRSLDTLPTSDAGLASGDLFTQTATQLGGSGTTKVICIK